LERARYSARCQPGEHRKPGDSVLSSVTARGVRSPSGPGELELDWFEPDDVFFLRGSFVVELLDAAYGPFRILPRVPTTKNGCCSPGSVVTVGAGSPVCSAAKGPSRIAAAADVIAKLQTGKHGEARRWERIPAGPAYGFRASARPGRFPAGGHHELALDTGASGPTPTSRGRPILRLARGLCCSRNAAER